MGTKEDAEEKKEKAMGAINRVRLDSSVDETRLASAIEELWSVYEDHKDFGNGYEHEGFKLVRQAAINKIEIGTNALAKIANAQMADKYIKKLEKVKNAEKRRKVFGKIFVIVIIVAVAIFALWVFAGK